MRLLWRFSAALAAGLALIAILLGFLVITFYERDVVKREKESLARHILDEARENLSEEDLSVARDSARYEHLQARMAHITGFSGRLLAILFLPDKTIAWSSYPSIVGDRMEDDPEIVAALQGKVTAEIRDPRDEGHDFPGDVDEILGIYVPVTFGSSSRVACVIEIYQDFGPMRLDIRRTKGWIWASLAAGFGILYLVLFGIVRQGDLLILKGQDELRTSREKIRSQNLELLGRIGASVRGEKEIGKLLREVAGEVRRNLDIPRCAILLFGDPDMVVEDLAPGVPSARQVFPDSPRPEDSKEIFRKEGMLVVNDVREMPGYGEKKEELARIGLGAYIGVPLRTQDGVQGVLFLDRAMPHRWTGEEVETAEVVAGQVAIAIRQARLSQEQEELSGRLLSLMNNVPGLVYRGYPDWSVGFFGAGAERITGYPAEAFTGGDLTWRDLILRKDREGIVQSMRDAIRRRDGTLRLEYRIRQKDGTLRWLADRRQLVYDPAGRLLHIDGLVLDITDRKLSEEMLRLTQFTVDRSGDAAYWMDADGRLLYVNEKICSALGYSREELLTMSIREINPDFPGDSWGNHWEEVRKRKTFTLETRHRAKDGRVIPVEVTVNHLEFGGKEFNCAFARDITERLRVREESRRLQEQLLQSQKMEALGILAGGVAHDFNNLLTGILGYADLMVLRAPRGSETAAAAGVIRESAERASRLTAQLLGFARKGKNLAVPVDLRRTAADVQSILERTLDRRIRIRTRFPEKPAMVVGDPTQLSQVVMNLGVNAKDAMPEGGELFLSIGDAVLDGDSCREIPGAAPGRYVVLSVRDTGVGIPEGNLSRVFEPFFTTKEPGKGSGLGLSMVFGIVKNHGGYIRVRSGEGEGTTVTAYLPAFEGEVAGEEFPEAPPVSPPGRKGRVLVVDDEETVRDVCASMLRAIGYDVITAENGEEGVARYRELWREIDLVILDMIMPRMGGRDCFRKIREINPQVRAILSTGYSLEGAVQEILREGMDGFIQKPYRLEQLSEALSQAMRRAS